MKRSRQQCAVAVAMVMAMCGAAAAAEEVTTQMKEVVVTATRDEVPIEQVGSSITVITAKEIEQKQVHTVADALRMVPGLDIRAYNGTGSLTEVALRGSIAAHTLVLIDGVEMNDPSNDKGQFNFANLTTDNIERIEILNGPQSTLYGSHAMGGVINIITKRGDGQLKGFLSVEAGSRNTYKESAGVNGSSKLFQYALGISRFDSKGISAADSKNGNTESDPYQNTTVSARVGITPLNNLDFDIALRYTKSRDDLDGYSTAPPYSFTDVYGYYIKSDQLFLRIEANLSLFNNWDQKLGMSLNDSKRDYSDGYYYDGQSIKLDWQHVVHLHKTNDITLGVEHKDEYAKADGMEEQHVATSSVYLQDQIKLFDRWFTTVGVRLDDHEDFGSKTTYRITTAYLLKESDTKIKGSYGTGFRAPSIYELYAPPYSSAWGNFLGGNQNLKPETSRGWDVGIEQGLPFMKTTLGTTWFRNDIKNMIDYLTDSSYNGYYDNANRAHSQGLEVTLSFQPADELSVKSTYTYTETSYDTASYGTIGKEWPYRPKHKASLEAAYNVTPNAHLNLGAVYVGSRYTDAANTKKMGDYTLINLAAAYDVTKNLQLFGRVDNLFDREYEEVAGYGTPGISAFGGVKVSF